LVLAGVAHGTGCAESIGGRRARSLSPLVIAAGGASRADSVGSGATGSGDIETAAAAAAGSAGLAGRVAVKAGGAG